MKPTRRLKLLFIAGASVFLVCVAQGAPAADRSAPAPSSRPAGSPTGEGESGSERSPGGALPINGIAAVVNGDVITYSQVRDLVGPREKLLRSQFSGEELITKIKEVRSAALKDLIDRQLILQAFNKEHAEVPDHYIDMQTKEIINDSFGGDRNTFIKTLQAQNFTLSEFKKMEKEKMIVQAMRGKNVKRSTMIPPAKVDVYYAQHRDEFTSREQVKLRMIMLPGKNADGNAAAQKAMAEELLHKLVGGAEFDRMAQMYSEDSTRDAGGDWGWIERKTLAAPLEKVAFNLPKGKISNIVELGGNYYILKVEDKRGGDSRPLAEVRAEIGKKLMQEESQHQQDVWLATLREKAYIRTF
ncbi:MAG TPA: peptidylprolyl isomerase [Chthoniobacterales bacterium]|nr:peptidylprolyl isomerase [Chthoniobacterales bacterium]